MISIFKEMWSPPKTQDSLELTRLYRSIEQAFDRQPGSSVAITSVHPTDQVLRMTYDLAWVGSTLLGKRVLVLDTTGQGSSGPVMRSWAPPRAAKPATTKPAADEPAADAPPRQALIDMDRALQEPNNVGLLSLRVSPAKDVAITPQLTEIWSKLESTFDLIIVAAPPVLADPTAACLGSVVDGTVLLVASGQARARDVERAVELLNSDSAPLLGVIMTDKQPTFPRWLQWIFGKG